MGLLQQYTGELAALATAFCWAITATAFEHSAKRIGSMNMNLLRLLLGLGFLSMYTFLSRGYWLPFDATRTEWFWLSLSGIVGIVIGDILLFEAFVRIGARISMLIYSSVPPLSGLMALFFLGEKMTPIQIAGMFITVAGIVSVILVAEKDTSKIHFSYPVLGVLFAFGGAAGQAGGYILGKYGMAGYDPFSATQIRLIAGIVSFVILFTVKNHWPKLLRAFSQKDALVSLTIGSFFGPFLGISLSLMAVQRINPGVASTLISLTPILLIPYAFIVKKEQVTLREIFGTVVALTGAAIMFV